MVSYNNKTIRFIPKRFESAETKKLRLQEKMSGLKHQFSIENAANVAESTSQQPDDENDIDPVDECKLAKEHPSYANELVH